MNGRTMKVRDLLSMEIDIDVYDDYTEELGIAFCGPAELTEEGKSEFGDVLDYDITIYDNVNEAVISINDYPDAGGRLLKASRLFYGLAGYCNESDYKKWFGWV